MESIKCRAEAVDIYIFLPATLSVRAGKSQPQLQQQRLQDPAWILSPTLIPTIPRKQHTPFLSTGSAGAAVAESTGWLILDEPHPREHSQPQHCSWTSLSKFPFVRVLFYTVHGEVWEGEGMLALPKFHIYFTSILLLKKTQIPRDKLVKLVQ